jgi:hypothetical protein
MTEDHDRYRRNAAMAREKAEQVQNLHDRNEWLRLMRDWLALIPAHARRPEDEPRG